MSKSIKAVLLSALVIPGAGHIYLKHYFTGAALIGATSLSLYYLITEAVEKALAITNKIQSGEVPLDAAVIAELLTKQTTGSEAQLQSIATAVFIISWIIGVIHSYITGRASEKTGEQGD